MSNVSDPLNEVENVKGRKVSGDCILHSDILCVASSHMWVTFLRICVCSVIISNHAFSFQSILSVEGLSGCAMCSLTPGTQPLRTSLWSMEASVRAGWALAFPIDHSDIESIVTVWLQPRQHAVSLAALESEDLLLNVASVPFRGALSHPVVNLKWQERTESQ